MFLASNSIFYSYDLHYLVCIVSVYQVFLLLLLFLMSLSLTDCFSSPALFLSPEILSFLRSIISVRGFHSFWFVLLKFSFSVFHVFPSISTYWILLLYPVFNFLFHSSVCVILEFTEGIIYVCVRSGPCKETLRVHCIKQWKESLECIEDTMTLEMLELWDVC